VKPPPPPPPENLPPPPKFAPPPPSFVPPPEVNVNPPPTPAPQITTTQVAPPPAPVTVVAAPAVVAAPPAPPRVAAKPAITSLDSCKPEYPAAALRAEATGSTKIRFVIGADGKLQSSEITKSSGPSREHKALDRQALQQLSQCTFRAGSDENGRPVGASVEVEYVWKLE
jgi:protein TonB